MPYTASLSRSEFLKQTDELVLHAKTETNKKLGTMPAPVMQLLFQSAIFRTSALLEEYLKDSISDWLSLADKSGLTCSSLPVNLKWYLVSNAHSPAYKEFYYLNDEKKLLEKLDAAPPNIILSASSAITGILNSFIVVGNRKYPSIKNIKTLFNRIGISNIFHRLDAITRRNSEMLLQSFIDIRQAIAHQSPPRLTYPEVKTYIRNVQGIVRALDRILYAHVIAHHGKNCWRTA
jgi:hypothetical protein